MTVRDSAGIEIVTVGAAPVDGEPWIATETPRLTVGDAMGPPPELFTDVRAAALLSDGRIVVADAGAAELRYFTPTGEWLGTAGGEGEGPGEFRSILYLGTLAGDSVLVYDRSLQRVSLFDPRGGFVGSWSTNVPGVPAFLYPAGSMSDGTLVATAFVGPEPEGEGVYLTAQEIGRLGREEGSYTVVDTILGAELARYRRDGRMMPAIVPFGRKSDVAVSPGVLYALDAGRPRSILVYGASGDLRRILRFDVPRTAVDPGLVARWTESFFRQYDFAAPTVEESWRRGFERVPAPEVVPLFRSLEADTEGNVCAERYGETETAPPVFWCFTPRGRLVRRIALAPGFKRDAGSPFQDPQLTIGPDWVLGVRLDDLSVERVEMLPLERRGGGR